MITLGIAQRLVDIFDEKAETEPTLTAAEDLRIPPDSTGQVVRQPGLA
jgi:hypothetical protein